MDAHRLDLILALDEQVQQLLGVHGGLAEVRHQPNQRRVPLVGHLCERGRPRRHQDLRNSCTACEVMSRLSAPAAQSMMRPQHSR